MYLFSFLIFKTIMITTIGVFTTHATAGKALQDLRDYDIHERDLSYLYANDDGHVKDGQSADKIGFAAVTGGATGAVIGGIAGLVIANGLIPGFGSLVIAGPLAEALGIAGATALVGAGAGLAAGGVIGALTKVGISSDEAHLYEDHVRRGGVLVISRTEDAHVKDIFSRNEGKDIQEYIMV
jgi:hypothetical protein